MTTNAPYGPGSPDWLERHDETEEIIARLRAKAEANQEPASALEHDPDGRRIGNAVEARNFIMAPEGNGSAVFTVVSTRTGERYTYRSKRSGDGALLFIGALTGPNNDADYTYLGIIGREDEFTTTRGTKVAPHAPVLVAFEWVWERLGLAKIGDLTADAGFEFWHEGRCGRCGRRLSVPESIEAGYGPTCQEHVLC